MAGAGQLPQLHPDRDGLREVLKVLNQLLLRMPGEGFTRQPLKTLNLMATSTTLVVPANVTGWITELAELVPTIGTGAITTTPRVRAGSNATHDNVIPLTDLAALTTGEVWPITLTIPALAITDIIYFEVERAAVGPVSLTANVSLNGYFQT